MQLIKSALIVLLLLTATSCGNSGQSTPLTGLPLKANPVPTKRIRIIVDEQTIANKDVHDIIKPISLSGIIDGSHDEYVQSLAKCSRGQKLVFAMQWYLDEVNNGGHDQFYSNSTGIVWEDAQAGFTEVGIPEIAQIIAESAKRMGGRPSFDRAERNDVLQSKKPKFDDLDNRFYKSEADINSRILAYIRKHPKDFLFDGEVEAFSP